MNFTRNYNAKYDENLSYDIRGNILSLQRNTANGAGMTPIDNLTYSYNSATNRLNTITDATANAAGFNVNGDQGCSSHTKWLVAKGKRSNRPGSRSEIERGSISVVKTLCFYKVLLREAHEGPWMMNNTAKDNAYMYNNNRSIPLVKWKSSATKALDSEGTATNWIAA